MKVIIALALFVALAFAAHTEKEYRDSFSGWMKQNGKSYSALEFQARYRKFKNNLDFIEAHNSKQRSYKVGLNKFADLSNMEFRKIFNGLRVPANLEWKATFVPDVSVQLPASFDWRTQGAVTGVKNQGQCGSCWSFSTTGSVEGCHKLGAGSLPSLSEQNLMDCSWNNGNQGCDGGLMTSAMDYIISNGGLDTESSYPYTAESSQTCNYAAANSGSTLGAYSNVASGDEGALQTAVNSGPTSVAIDASQSSFQLYTSGVYNEPACSSSQLDHGVLAVGWGNDPSGGDYWIVKNSWGTDWGQSGYIWMSRNNGNQCGIATMATLPTGCK